MLIAHIAWTLRHVCVVFHLATSRFKSTLTFPTLAGAAFFAVRISLGHIISFVFISHGIRRMQLFTMFPAVLIHGTLPDESAEPLDCCQYCFHRFYLSSFSICFAEAAAGRSRSHDDVCHIAKSVPIDFSPLFRLFLVHLFTTNSTFYQFRVYSCITAPTQIKRVA